MVPACLGWWGRLSPRLRRRPERIALSQSFRLRRLRPLRYEIGQAFITLSLRVWPIL
jgi:hypothetical protein